MGTFAAQVANWGEKAKRNSAIVFRSAVQKLTNSLHSDVGTGMGATPFLTGNLRRSLLGSSAAMPMTSENDNFADGMGATTLIIQGLDIGDTFFIGFQANYARRLEYGFVGEDSLGRNYNQSGRFFVRSKAHLWQQFVNQAVAELGD